MHAQQRGAERQPAAAQTPKTNVLGYRSIHADLLSQQRDECVHFPTLNRLSQGN